MPYYYRWLTLARLNDDKAGVWDSLTTALSVKWRGAEEEAKKKKKARKGTGGDAATATDATTATEKTAGTGPDSGTDKIKLE